MLKCKYDIYIYIAILKFHIYLILVNRIIEFTDKTVRK